MKLLFVVVWKWIYIARKYIYTAERKWKASRDGKTESITLEFHLLIEKKMIFSLLFFLSYDAIHGLNWIYIEALYILTSTTKQRFEFIFTDYGTNPSHFASIFEIYKIYQATALYRELKLRSAILTDGQLNILPQEQVYNQLSGIYNLSSDQVCILNSCLDFKG